jgi:lipid-A-disaccharide synthase-like uncharacterized protein
MRRALFRIGWIILFAAPIAFIAEAVVEQDMPTVQPWKWAILAASVLLIYAFRDRDDVLKHHLAV